MRINKMTDLMPELRQALTGMETDGLLYQVSEAFPQNTPSAPLVTLSQVEDRTVNAVVDAVSFQVDIWAANKDHVRLLAPLVNDRLMGLGLLRDYTGPIEYYAAGNGGYFRKTMRFGRKVDKRFMRLID